MTMELLGVGSGVGVGVGVGVRVGIGVGVGVGDGVGVGKELGRWPLVGVGSPVSRAIRASRRDHAGWVST